MRPSSRQSPPGVTPTPTPALRAPQTGGSREERQPADLSVPIPTRESLKLGLGRDCRKQVAA